MKNVGPYELQDELGRGGMGSVLRVRHVPTGAIRALKLLDGAYDDEGLERFRREARALAALGGKGVVRIHDLGVEAGRAWFAMDLMEGGSLRDSLRLRGRFEWREACRLAARLARTLALCHERGLVHRDVKPDNVLFSHRAGATADQGEPCLADFGCVREPGAARLTLSGALLGTPDYMAPEQLRGEAAGAPADVFALGVILHELVTGLRPHEGSPVALLRKIMARDRAKVALAGDVPAALDGLLGRALAPDPALRPTAAVLAAELEDLAAGKLAAPARGRAPLAVALALAGVGVVALAALVARSTRRDPGATPAVSPSPGPRAGPGVGAPSLLPLASPSPVSAEVAELESRVVSYAVAFESAGDVDPNAAFETGKRLGQLRKKDRAAYARALGRLARAAWRASVECYTDASHLDQTSPSERRDAVVAALDLGDRKLDEERDGLEPLVRAVLHWTVLHKAELARSVSRQAPPTPTEEDVRLLEQEAVDARAQEDPRLSLGLRWRAVEALWLRGSRLVQAGDHVALERIQGRYRESVAALMSDARAAIARDRDDSFVRKLGRDVIRQASDLAAIDAQHGTQDARCASLARAIDLREEAAGLSANRDKREDDLHALARLRFEGARGVAARPDALRAQVAALEALAENPGLLEHDRFAIRAGIAHRWGTPETRGQLLERLRHRDDLARVEGKARFVLLVAAAALELDAGDPAAARARLEDARPLLALVGPDSVTYSGESWREIDEACPAAGGAREPSPGERAR